MDMSWLPTYWAGMIAFGILVYVILDGYDLGVGILFGTTRHEEFRADMMRAIAPYWDGNETWLILIGATLFGAFPMLYAIFLPAFYLPVTLMLCAFIFRGVAFEFRYRSDRMRWLWDWGFFLGSLIAAFVQGAAIGAMVQELPVSDGRYAGGAFNWFSAFSVICGAGLVFGYALLGACWLVLKATGDLREWAYRRITGLLFCVLAVLGVVSIYTLLTELPVLDRWMTNSWMMVIPGLGALASVLLMLGVWRRRDGIPFAMAALLFLAAFLALGASFWPYMIPYSITIEQAAAPPESLKFLFYGAGIVVFPVVIIYTAVVYWIFHGKTSQDNYG